jgi:hypothetical protein
MPILFVPSHHDADGCLQPEPRARRQNWQINYTVNAIVPVQCTASSVHALRPHPITVLMAHGSQLTLALPPSIVSFGSRRGQVPALLVQMLRARVRHETAVAGPPGDQGAEEAPTSGSGLMYRRVSLRARRPNPRVSGRDWLAG